MNVNTLNISHYRLTDTSGRRFDLFNRDTNEVYSITGEEHGYIVDHTSVEACDVVCDRHRRQSN